MRHGFTDSKITQFDYRSRRRGGGGALGKEDVFTFEITEGSKEKQQQQQQSAHKDTHISMSDGARSRLSLYRVALNVVVIYAVLLLFFFLPMNDFSVMNVLDSQADLNEPIQDDGLCEIFSGC